ncbi:MAG: DinB family protein [Bacteroidota bacterium]
MNEKLNRELQSLDKGLSALLKEMKVYSDDQLNRSHGEGKWSAIQIMHHLMMSERYSLKYVQKKLSFNPELKKAGFKSTMRRLLVTSYLGSPLKIKAPEAISGENLPDFVSFWDSAKSWKSQREELRAYLEQLPNHLLDKEIYKHPFAGRLSILGMLRFFNAHFKRHHKQVRRVLKQMVPVGGNVKV